MVDDKSLGRALDQIAFGCVGRDDVANVVRYAAFERQRNSRKRMAQGFAALALAALAVGADFVFQELAHVGQNGPAITVSRSIGNARPMNSCMASALWRAMCTTQRLCSMKVMGQFGTSRVKGILVRSSAFSGLRSKALIQVCVTCSRRRVSSIH